MRIEQLFNLDDEQLQQLYSRAGYKDDFLSYLDHDLDFQQLVVIAEAIDEFVVENHLQHGATSLKFLHAKQ